MNDVQKCKLENLFKDIKAEMDRETNKKSALYNFNFEDEVPIASETPRFLWSGGKPFSFQFQNTSSCSNRTVHPSAFNHAARTLTSN